MGDSEPKVRGSTPSEYLDRLLLQNLIFNDDIRLERIVVTSEKPVIITSQPSIKGKEPNQAALDAMMEAKGYQTLDEGAYYDITRSLLIFDLFPRNAIQAANEVIIRLIRLFSGSPQILRSSCVYIPIPSICANL
jgi:hypothetical protein